MSLLTEVEVESFTKITSVKVTLGEGVTEITGGNAEGKSSFLNALWVLIKGKSVAPPEPIRQGAERARIRGKIGEYVVTRTFRRTKSDTLTSELRIERGGEACESTEKFLKGLIGEHMLDPGDFIRLDKKGKYDALRALVPGYDFEDASRQDKLDREKRRDINRDGEEAAAAASMISYPTSTPNDPVDEAAILQRMTEAAEANADIERRRGNRERAKSEIEQQRQRALQLTDQAEKLLQEAEQLRNTAAATETRIAAAGELPAPVDIAILQAEASTARNVNKAVADKQRRQQLVLKVQGFQEDATKLTVRIEARERAKREAIAAANIPIEGLSFGDGEILLHELPFSQASTAEQIKTGFALAVLRNPTLRLVWIRDASLLDDDSYAFVKRLANEYRCQVVLETVRAIGQDAIVIEDGTLQQSKAA